MCSQVWATINRKHVFNLVEVFEIHSIYPHSLIIWVSCYKKHLFLNASLGCGCNLCEYDNFIGVNVYHYLTRNMKESENVNLGYIK